MADNSPPTTPVTAGPGTAIPLPMGPRSDPKYHWWYDTKQAGAGNSPPGNMTGHSPTSSYSILSQSPPAGGDADAANKRRDSLKNMYHLYDFATP